jgi:16S rRNA (cytosine967-C5)-methyltransferase
MSVGADLRAEAAGLLEAVLYRGHSLKAALAQALPLWPDSRDRALIEAICFAALRHRRRYEFALSQWMPRPLPDRDRIVQALLLAGLAQIDGLGLAAHAAVSASVDAAKRLGHASSAGLVNALLRRALREGLPTSEDPAVAHSHPDWLVEQLRKDWPTRWPELLAEDNRAAPLWLRANTSKLSRDALLERLAPIALHAPAFPPAAIRLDEAGAPTRLPGWDEGLFAVQDGAAQLAVEALGVRDGERVLDACAAPGGKTAQLASSMASGDIVALDSDATRLAKVGQTLERLRLSSPRIALEAADAAQTERWWDGRAFDAILVDAPCSATGIIRRQPDIKWHRRRDDIRALVAQQARLLDALWPLLRPGGRLLYCTCSVLKDENERQVAGFLSRTPAMQARSLDERFGHESGDGRQRFPGEDGMDGFFYALMTRRG